VAASTRVSFAQRDHEPSCGWHAILRAFAPYLPEQTTSRKLQSKPLSVSPIEPRRLNSSRSYTGDETPASVGEVLHQEAQVRVLAIVGYNLTMVARDTYEFRLVFARRSDCVPSMKFSTG
jgi:hypothetical protein